MATRKEKSGKIYRTLRSAQKAHERLIKKGFYDAGVVTVSGGPFSRGPERYTVLFTEKQENPGWIPARAVKIIRQGRKLILKIKTNRVANPLKRTRWGMRQTEEGVYSVVFGPPKGKQGPTGTIEVRAKTGAQASTAARRELTSRFGKGVSRPWSLKRIS